jgi:hypothetical protein
MIYYTTKEFFTNLRQIKKIENLAFGDAKWISRFYVASARNFCLSEKQALTLESICNKYDKSIIEYFIIESFEAENGKN